MKMKLYRVTYAEHAGDYVQHDFVEAKTRRTAEKIIRQRHGDVVIDFIHEECYSYSRELAFNNID